MPRLGTMDGGLDARSADGVKAKWILCFDPFCQSRDAAALCGAKCGKGDRMGLFEYWKGKERTEVIMDLAQA